MSKLSTDELNRYARHIVLPEIGGAGQQKLKAARIVVVGVGGLGSPAVQYLAAAGIGTLVLIDDDQVSLSNLQRQVLHTTTDIDQPKVVSGQSAIAALNPNVTVECHQTRIDESNCASLLQGADVVLDGSDNFATRYLLADVCETLGIALVSAAVNRFDGSITTLMPHLKDDQGRSYPRYRDLLPEPPPDHLQPTCAEVGVLGVLTGLMGTLQALEAIKVIVGIGDPLIGKLLMVDALSMRFETIGYQRKSAP